MRRVSSGSQHAWERYLEFHPDADWYDMLAAANRGRHLDRDLVVAFTQRPAMKHNDGEEWRLSPCGGLIFSLLPHRARPEHLFIVTCVRLRETQRAIMADPTPNASCDSCDVPEPDVIETGGKRSRRIDSVVGHVARDFVLLVRGETTWEDVCSGAANGIVLRLSGRSEAEDSLPEPPLERAVLVPAPRASAP